MTAMRSTVAFVLGIGAIGALVQCSPFGGGDFTCAGDESCTGGTGGRCEPTGYCSFADTGCADGHRYGDGPQAGQCVGGGQTPVDAPVDMIDAPFDAAVLIDSSIDAAPMLYCVGQLVKVCLPSKPSADYNLPSVLDTSGAPCRTDATDGAGNPLTGYCVLAGANVGADSLVIGNRPLIVIATNTLTVNVLLDVASHRGMGNGPGADYANCGNGVGLDGTNGGGGGGGGFGGNGGAGGNHGPDKGGMGGKKGAPTMLRGGCAGGNGSLAGKVGHGGGAVMLYAASTIAIKGALDASGSGADSAGSTKEYGGSGGGSGGMIVLEAPMINNTGFVTANGGGGASGASSGGVPSVAGSDPSATSTGAASGGKPTSQNGGFGGDGGATTKPDGTDGQDGQPFNTMNGGAGGGGGGVGAILTHGGTLTGNASPGAQGF